MVIWDLGIKGTPLETKFQGVSPLIDFYSYFQSPPRFAIIPTQAPTFIDYYFK